MSNTIILGKVSFVNHEKKYILIEYEVNGKKKAINGKIDDKTQQELIDKKIIKKKHHFHIGDMVNFIAKLADRGDKMIACNIQYKYNEALDVLINKAKTNNLFIGYLKEVDGKYFVKEIDSYLFLPTNFSPWQIKPTEDELNEQVNFTLENTGNKEKAIAQLTKVKYIPEYYVAEKAFKQKITIDTKVYAIKPHGIFVNVVTNKIQAKLPFKEGVKIDDVIPVKIIYLTPFKIVVEAL
ncbi:MAG: hypothetical protein IPP48_15520 [Chitinophagaceae bacterium]|nr:hypothetical protein [Chitinophagaceae bacterium]